MSDPARCEPPPEYRLHRWHWLVRRDFSQEPMIWEWGVGRELWIGRPAAEIAAEGLAEAGWRYLGVAIPPEQP